MGLMLQCLRQFYSQSMPENCLKFCSVLTEGSIAVLCVLYLPFDWQELGILQTSNSWLLMERCTYWNSCREYKDMNSFKTMPTFVPQACLNVRLIIHQFGYCWATNHLFKQFKFKYGTILLLSRLIKQLKHIWEMINTNAGKQPFVLFSLHYNRL